MFICFNKEIFGQIVVFIVVLKFQIKSRSLRNGSEKSSARGTNGEASDFSSEAFFFYM